MLSAETKKKLIFYVIFFLIIAPFWYLQKTKKKTVIDQLKIDPITIDCIITKIDDVNRKGVPKVYYKYTYNDIMYENKEECSRLIYKHREDDRKDIHGFTYFSVVGDTFKIIISKSHPEYSRFIHDPFEFKKKYYSK